MLSYLVPYGVQVRDIKLNDGQNSVTLNLGGHIGACLKPYKFRYLKSNGLDI